MLAVERIITTTTTSEGISSIGCASLSKKKTDMEFNLTIGQGAERRQMPMCVQSTTTQLAERGISKAWLAKNQTFSALEARYSPKYWAYVAARPEEACTAECPALGALKDIYGEPGAAASWIDTQLTTLFLSSGCKDEGLASGISVFASSFAASAAPYKLTELMLFFSNYKAGKYDDSFAMFNPQRIGNCFFRKFLPERNAYIAKAEDEKRLAETEAMYRRIAEGKTMGYNEWQRYKPWMENGASAEEFREEWKELYWLFRMGYEADPVTGKIKDYKPKTKMRS